MSKRLLKRVFDGIVVPSTRWAAKSITDRAARTPLRHQPAFIIGAPRTGSTILYQALTNVFDVLYVDNLACRWSGNLPFGIWLSGLIYGRKPHGNFTALHGDTSRFGGHAPSECGAFWYRWLPRERHFVDDPDITQDIVDGIYREVSAAINLNDRPLVFKNMNAGQRLRLIRRTFPHAKFIHIRRDPRNVVQSILKARRAAGFAPGSMWSIRPNAFEKLLTLPEEEMVVAQVAAIEDQIVTDLRLFPAENIATVNFEELSGDVVAKLGSFIGASRRAEGVMPAFRPEPSPEPHPQLERLVHRYFGNLPPGASVQ